MEKLYDYEIKHNELLRSFGAECAVLLKSDGAFPLDGPCRLALYGSGARRTIKGGTGSGEVNSRYSVNAEEGLEAAGFIITTKNWMDRYEQIYADARKAFVKKLKRDALKRFTLAILDSMGAVAPEPEYELPLDADADTAVYVLSRISGEGSDRSPVAGDILLTNTEIRDILELNRKYDKFLLVLNVGGPVDLSPVKEVRNILLLSQLGSETGNVLADLVLGKSYPSGKLATTWTAWEDYPTIGGFGDRNDTEYTEGVYVGYRYFDSIGKKALFPFGFGLGYTSFEIEAGEESEGGAVSAEGSMVTVKTTVKNTGAHPGKEVVQLYVSSPAGKIDKPYQTLAAYEKTAELKPGEAEELTMSFDLRDIAVYDTERASWILEAGDYVLRLRSSSVDNKPVAIVRLDVEAIVRKVKNFPGKPEHSDWKPETIRTDDVPDVPVVTVRASDIGTESAYYVRPQTVDPLIETLTDEALCLMNIGAFRQSGSKDVIGNAGQSVAGSAGETANYFKDKGIPALMMADGPAGLRLSRQYTKDENGVHAIGETMPESVMELMPAPAAFFMKHFMSSGKTEGEVFDQYCSALPIGTAIAQSWNTELAEACGDIVGSEMERFGVNLWLAPALNIHRNIRCGRNYEYFSEDPLISGKVAAAITRGVQKHSGCGVTLKHFAANNQETNRFGSNSVVSERALREIYLRGFEIAVKESDPRAVMTSYNLLNGVHTSERRDLAEDVLRCEFGFTGIVMTDWIIPIMYSKKNKWPAPNAARTAAAGGDLIMPGGKGDFDAMLKGLKDGTVSRKQLQINATRVYRLAKELRDGI